MFDAVANYNTDLKTKTTFICL